MRIPEKKIEELQEIYRKNFDKDISRAEALDIGREIIDLMKIIYRPIKKKDYEKIRERRKETREMLKKIYDEGEEKEWY